MEARYGHKKGHGGIRPAWGYVWGVSGLYGALEKKTEDALKRKHDIEMIPTIDTLVRLALAKIDTISVKDFWRFKKVDRDDSLLMTEYTMERIEPKWTLHGK